MNLLAEILSSRVRADILRLLFSDQRQELHVRAMERQSCVTLNAVRQELKKLHNLDLVRNRRDGNRLYYKANINHPLHSILSELVAKTVGVTAILKQSLSIPTIQFAFIFGSMATNSEGAESDIDLMIIGDVGLRELSTILSGQEQQTGREINPHIYSKKEFHKRLSANDHLVSKIMSGEKIFIVGTENELNRL